MKAIRLLEFGGQLVFDDVAVPAMARDEVLAKIKSTAVNHIDLVKASGTLSQPGYQLSRSVVREGSGREGRCGLRLGRWRFVEAIISRLEGGRPSRLCHPARIAGRGYEVSCVGRNDEARAVSGYARKNRATVGTGDDTTRRSESVRAPGYWPGLQGYRQETARGSWDVAQ